MGLFGAISSGRRKLVLWVALPLVAAFLLQDGVREIGPAWQANQGHGVTGTFTATHEQCGRRSCTMRGTFESADGSITREDLVLRDAKDSLHLGEQLPALDTGSPSTVFPVDGSGSGLWVSIGFIAVGLIALVGWVFFGVRALRRRRHGSVPVPAA